MSVNRIPLPPTWEKIFGPSKEEENWKSGIETVTGHWALYLIGWWYCISFDHISSFALPPGPLTFPFITSTLLGIVLPSMSSQSTAVSLFSLCFIRVCPGESVQFFQKTKLRIFIIIWIVIEIWTLNFMFLTTKLAGSVKYIVFDALFVTAREKKIMFLKEVDFVGSVSTKIKFILIHNLHTIIITNQKQSKLICKF